MNQLVTYINAHDIPDMVSKVNQVLMSAIRKVDLEVPWQALKDIDAVTEEIMQAALDNKIYIHHKLSQVSMDYRMDILDFLQSRGYGAAIDGEYLVVTWR